MGCCFLLLGIFPTQGLNLRLLHCKQIPYCWATGEVQINYDISIKWNAWPPEKEWESFYVLICTVSKIIFKSKVYSHMKSILPFCFLFLKREKRKRIYICTYKYRFCLCKDLQSSNNSCFQWGRTREVETEVGVTSAAHIFWYLLNFESWMQTIF